MHFSLLNIMRHLRLSPKKSNSLTLLLELKLEPILVSLEEGLETLGL